MLPRSVSIVVGDVGEPSTLRAAVQGCNKIIYCATARSAITGDLNRVDYQGVCNVTKAFQVLFCRSSLLAHLSLVIVVFLPNIFIGSAAEVSGHWNSYACRIITTS